MKLIIQSKSINSTSYLTALTSLCLTSTAFSQTNNFTGLSLALSASHVDAKNTTVAVDPLLGTFTLPSYKNNFIPGVDISYGFAIGNNFVVGLGATYDFTKTETGVPTINAVINGEDLTTTLPSTLKDHYSLYIQPTYVINKDSAMFAKLGRHFAQVKTTGSTTIGGELAGQAETTSNIEGWGYGLGFKNFLSNNLFIQGDVVAVDYKKINFDLGGTPTSIKPETLNATISVGYKF